MSHLRTYQHGTPRTFVCPYCLHEYPVEQILFHLPLTGQKLTGKRNYIQRWMRRPPIPPPLNGDVWEKLCPGVNCGKVLPKSTGMEPSLIIGMVGAQVSGKTHYIASLIQRLSSEVGERFQVGVVEADSQTTKRFAVEFKQPLYDNKAVLDSTIGSPPPLIYNLVFDGSLYGENEPRSVTLALYDTAGENFRDPVKVREMASYLRVAAGVIFIVDPLQSEAVRQMVGSQVQLPTLKYDNMPTNIIRNLTELLDNQGIIRGNRPFQTPVAVTMSKADVLRDVDLIKDNAPWNGPEMHELYFDDDLHEQIEGTMRNLFKQYEPAAYHNVRVRFKNHAFFGVSATGCSPDPRTHRYAHVSPRRVEDPLLWLLAEIGVIPRRRGSRQ